MCKVSIIMPSLNVRDYIDECIQSVINQELRDIEIICVDAGSTDGTREIIERYADSDDRIRLLPSDKKSYGHQMNLGVKAARGKYVAIVETDDFVEADMYERMVKIADEDNLDFVKGGHWIVKGEKGKYYRERVEAFPPDKRQYLRKVITNDVPLLLSADMHTWAGIYRRDFLIENDIWHNETPGAAYQDNGFWFQTMMHAKRAEFIEEAFYNLRRDNPNSSFFAKDKLESIRHEFDFIHDAIEKWNPDNKQLLFAYCFYFRFKNYCGQTRRVPKEAFPLYYELLREDTTKAYSCNEVDLRLFNNRQFIYLFYILKRTTPTSYDDVDTFIWNDKFIALNRCKHIYIYGAGQIGKRTYKWLEKFGYDGKTDAFLVTRKNEQESDAEIPVLEIDSASLDDDSLIIVAVGRRLREQLIEELKKREIENYVFWPFDN